MGRMCRTDDAPFAAEIHLEEEGRTVVSGRGGHGRDHVDAASGEEPSQVLVELLPDHGLARHRGIVGLAGVTSRPRFFPTYAYATARLRPRPTPTGPSEVAPQRRAEPRTTAARIP